MSKVIENFVHDIRTPLASIQLGAHGIKNYLPIILQQYQDVRDGKEIKQPVSKETMKLLLQVTENIEKEIARMQEMLNQLVEETRE